LEDFGSCEGVLKRARSEQLLFAKQEAGSCAEVESKAAAEGTTTPLYDEPSWLNILYELTHSILQLAPQIGRAAVPVGVDNDYWRDILASDA